MLEFSYERNHFIEVRRNTPSFSYGDIWLVVAFFGLLWAAFHVVNMLPFVLFGAMLFVFLVAAAYLEIKTQKEEGRRDAQVPDTGEQR